MIHSRSFTMSDAQDLYEMMRDFYAIDAYPFDAEKMAANIAQFHAEPHSGRIELLLVDGQIAGYFVLTYIYSFEFGGRMAFIDELYVKSEFRHMGIGRFALDEILKFAKTSGLKMLYLEVEPQNQRASELYASRGFTFSKRGFMRREL